MASLCAADFASNNISVSNVYTFGEPRVGNSVFAKYYNSLLPNSWREIHWKDIVPHVPLEWIGFYHEATEVWFPETWDDKWTVCNGGEDPNCSDSLWSADSVSDHLVYHNFPISNYC